MIKYIYFYFGIFDKVKMRELSCLFSLNYSIIESSSLVRIKHLQCLSNGEEKSVHLINFRANFVVLIIKMLC